MKKIIFKKDCKFNEQFFVTKDELDVSKVKDWSSIWKLNEQGYIEPLTLEEFRKIQESTTKEKKPRKEGGTSEES